MNLRAESIRPGDVWTECCALPTQPHKRTNRQVRLLSSKAHKLPSAVWLTVCDVATGAEIVLELYRDNRREITRA